MSDNPTDAELVEAVAREVLKFDESWILVISQYGSVGMMHDTTPAEYWYPLTDANDLRMVKEKFVDYQHKKRKGRHEVIIYGEGGGMYAAESRSEVRAWLEAALKARRENEHR